MTSNNLNDKIKYIDEIIYKFLPEEVGLQKTVIGAMNYSVKVGGKRIRPMLMLETYKLFGGNENDVYPFMAAIEMIHTYSLVHDDLPCMDDDELRRGKPTTHKIYGETMGVLAGDGLLNYAFEVVANAMKEVYVTNHDKVRAYIDAFTYLSKSAGVYGMIGGQVVDIESENKSDISRETLDYIYDNKTGKLLKAAMVIGAILAGASRDEINTIEKVASNVGLAFQIQDDILDVTSTEEILGKPIGSDEKNNKSTYVSFEGVDKAKEDVLFLMNEAILMLRSLNNSNEVLEELLEYLINRDK